MNNKLHEQKKYEHKVYMNKEFK